MNDYQIYEKQLLEQEVLKYVRTYYDFCNDNHTVPEEGLPKLAYELGQKVRASEKKKIKIMSRLGRDFPSPQHQTEGWKITKKD